jgi:hypothetical protein
MHGSCEGCAGAESCIVSSLPSPREAAGRGWGWGVPPQTRCERSKPRHPPPPTPPRHAQERVEGGEITVHDSAISKSRLRDLQVATPRSRGALRPSFANRSALQTEGARECRMPSASAASCAHGSGRMHTSIHSGRTGNHPASPHANGFNGFLRALPGDQDLLSPSPVKTLFSRT